MRTELFVVKIQAGGKVEIGRRPVAFFGFLGDEFGGGLLAFGFAAVFGDLVAAGGAEFAEIDHDVTACGVDYPEFAGFAVGVGEGLFHGFFRWG